MSTIAGELISDLYARVERVLSRLGVQDHGGDPLAALESWADDEHARCIAATDEHNALTAERDRLVAEMAKMRDKIRECDGDGGCRAWAFAQEKLNP